MVSWPTRRHGRFTSGIILTAAVSLALLWQAGPAGASTVWKASSTPLPANASPEGGVEAQSITCVTMTWCAAVGAYRTNVPTKEAFADVLSQGVWKPFTIPLPSDAGDNPGARLNSVSCAAVGSCGAVGHYFDKSGNKRGLIATFSGGTWTTIPAPLPDHVPASSVSVLNSVSCPQTGRCVAAGLYQEPSGEGQGLLLVQSGASWTATTAPLPPDAANNPFGDIEWVSCPQAGTCTGVGAYINTAHQQLINIDSLSSGKWSSIKAPLPARRADDPRALVGFVHCPAVGQCIAGGHFVGLNGSLQGLLLLQTGGTWRALRAPLPADKATDPGANIASASCPTTTRCVAVGFYKTTGDVQLGLVDTLSNNQWSAEPASVAGDISGTFLASISCAPNGRCAVVGNSNAQGVLGTYLNGKWTFVPAPLPSGSGKATFLDDAVSCRFLQGCQAFGTYARNLGTHGLFETVAVNP